MRRLAPFAFAVVLAAQEGSGYDRDTLSREGFVAAEPSVARDEVSGGGLLLAAYGALWLLLGGYAFGLARRQTRAVEDLDALRRRLAEIDADIDAAERSGRT